MYESQLEGHGCTNSFGFSTSLLNKDEANVSHESNNLCVMSLELHINTRKHLLPDPAFDAITCVFFSLYLDHNLDKPTSTFAICLGSSQFDSRVFSSFQISLNVVDTEIKLFDELSSAVKKHDPDILIGFDVQRYSWGYALDRAKTLDIELCSMLSRVPDTKENWFTTEDHWWALAELKIVGRIVLNLWKLLRHEAALRSYSFEHVCYHFLHRRYPFYTYNTLTKFWECHSSRNMVVSYYCCRSQVNIDLLIYTDILNRTTEMAKLYGIQFYDALTRGTQYRVESMMLRMTRAKNYVALSPSVQQRSRMAAPECIPLTLEPESGFYNDPVLVLDFQSLYPSIIIAYNYCYSTCLGKVHSLNKMPHIPLGCWKYPAMGSNLKEIHNKIHFSPAGVAFVKNCVRPGILPKMLQEILNTRIMVKTCMKKYKKNRALHSVLDARQLALKLIANVTYGYTSANFSGRMPCVEIADSIVHKGRETLERAIALVNKHDKWGARVIYGDTDSMFVLLRGRSKDEAFRIGADIAQAVTNVNPTPVKLKFEKVFMPCVLQSKKRYVGYSYETADQSEPLFDAKGIETVRRDTCPAASKILCQCLHLLFDNCGDVEVVEDYVMQQINKILKGTVALSQFVFAREYRGRQGYKPGASVPALKIARENCVQDPRSEPRMKERVPYVIVRGTPSATLLSCVVHLPSAVKDMNIKINYPYYIQGVLVPVLNRVFKLLKQDVRQWIRKEDHIPREKIQKGKRKDLLRLSQYIDRLECVCCRQPTNQALCVTCSEHKQSTHVTLYSRYNEYCRRVKAVNQVCHNCTGSSLVKCESIDCPLYFKRISLHRDVHSLADNVKAIQW